MPYFIRIVSILRLWIIVSGCILLGLALGEVVPLVWTFQQPTYLIEETTGLTKYTCDTNKPECKVNFDFTASIPSEEPISHYACTINFGFGSTPEDNKCNPDTVVFPIGEYQVHVVITHIDSNIVVQEGGVSVNNSPLPPPTTVEEDGGGDIGTNPTYAVGIMWQSATHLLVKENTTLSDYICDTTVDSCQINLLVIPQKNDLEDPDLTCVIVADFELTIGDEPCNPLPSVVPIGEHVVTIQILKKSDASIITTRTITLKNAPNDISIDPTRVTMQLDWQLPSYIVGKEDTTLAQYVCDPEKTECRINPLITPLLDGHISSEIICHIFADFELISTSDACNPNTSPVPLGDHTITIEILQKSNMALLVSREIILKNTPINDTINPTSITALLSWQSPTYFLQKEDATLTEYTCDSSQAECRMNLLVTPLIDGVENARVTCHIFSDFDLISTDNPCNPNTSLVPIGEHILTIQILQKSDMSVLVKRDIALKNPIRDLGGGGTGSGGGGGSSGILMDLNLSHIVIQSGLDEGGNCRSEACQVNFLAETPSGALCFWDFGTGIFETKDTDKKCNPGYIHFPFDSSVALTITDPNNSSNSITKTLSVFHTKKITENSPQPQAFIDIQGVIGKNKRLLSNGIICEIGNGDTCSLNFTGEKSVGAKTYFWNFGNGNTSDKANPGSEKYPLGKYHVRFVAINEAGLSSEVFYDIEVVKKFDILPEKECLECEKMKGNIHISAVLPNPPHADTVEWIELKNISQESYFLDSCTLSDESKKYLLSGTITPGKILRFRQIQTGISLGNSHETLELHCGGLLIDSFSWNFAVPDGYILRREMLDTLPTQVRVINVVDGDTIDVLFHDKKTRIRLLGVDTPETVHPLKAVEKFGKEASDFTKNILTGKIVWMTFDHELLDHYGRTLAYIWQCDDSFSTEFCHLFNARLISEGYGRMERRFAFMYYDQFHVLEGIAKKAKIGIWSDPDVVRELTKIGIDEENKLKKEQEEEYLKLQKELLELVKKQCEEEGICENIPTWAEITQKMTTLSVRSNTFGEMNISGRSWGKFPLTITVFFGGNIVYSTHSITDESGQYQTAWYPKIPGDYMIEVLLEEQDTLEGTPKENIVKIEKQIIIQHISDHFLIPLSGSIVLQGAQTHNRRVGADGIFYCLSRAMCSINVIAEFNRKNAIRYEWVLPSGEIFIGKNPSSFKIPYGNFIIKLVAIDEITGEQVEASLVIHHQAIPKVTKKSSSSNYTIDLKDATLDTGGGGIDEESPVNLGGILLVLSFLSLLSLLLFGGKKI